MFVKYVQKPPGLFAFVFTEMTMQKIWIEIIYALK